MTHAVKVHIRNCRHCGRDEWWIAPRNAAGRTITVLPSPLSSWWVRLFAGLMAPRIGWWWLGRQVERDMFHGPALAEIGTGTALCTNCGTELNFNQSPG